ncbi:MAG: ARMT1-like domain-containing protein [Atopobiaceae bacterium]|nr:ARMT1-like domain-containing protein [Atopobiaceae bacterium]
MLPACKECNVGTMTRLADLCGYDADTEAALVSMARSVTDSYPTDDDFSRNCENEGDIWGRLEPIIGTDDPYAKMKREYNDLTLSMEGTLVERIRSAASPAQTALRYAAVGNLIDFGPSEGFTPDDLVALIDSAPSLDFVVDDSAELLERAARARTLTYVADNCGEIAFDKVLIRELTRENPSLRVTYVVRRLPILNDNTMVDADHARMDEVARVIDNGDAHHAAGSVMGFASEEFRRALADADVVIAKGQGNLETLAGNGRADIFFMFMAKCALLAQGCGVEMRSLVCSHGSPNGFATRRPAGAEEKGHLS